MMTQIKCGHCGSAIQAETYDVINTSERPELKAKVMDGSLFVAVCPECGGRELLRYRTLYHNPSEKIMVWLTEGSTELEEKIQQACSQNAGLKDYSLRFVVDVGSLVEKIKVLEAGLDDIAVEMTKYVTKMELCGKNKEQSEAIMAATFRFLKLDGADKEICFAYPFGSSMQMVSAGFNLYEDSLGVIRRNPDIFSASSNFCRIDEEWIGKLV